MKVKTLALLMMSAIFFVGCNTAPVDETTENTETDLEVEAEANLFQVDDSDVVLASNFTDFSQAEYEAAIAEGKDVFLDFHADWCATCVANEPTVRDAFKELDDDSIVGFKVNYDTSAEFQKEFGVVSQATFVLISNGDVNDFKITSVGVVDEDYVLEFVQS